MVSTILETFKLAVALLAFYAYFTSLSFHQKKHTYLSFFVISLFHNIFSLLFFYNFLPGSWTPSVPFQYIVLTFFIVFASLFSSLAFLIVPYSFLSLQKRNFSSIFNPLLIGFLFFLADVLRSLLLSFFYLGEESSIGLRLFLGSLGETLTFTPLSLFAYKGGVFFLSAVLATISYLLFLFLKKKLAKKTAILSLSFLCTWYILVLLIPRTPLPNLSIDIVTTAFQNESAIKDTETYIYRYKTMYSLINKKKGGDLLIFPESTYFLSLHEILKESNDTLPYTYVLDSGDLEKKSGRFSYSFFYDVKNDITEVRGKDDLMIFNEYSSYFANLLYKIIAKNDDVSSYRKAIDTKRSNSYHTFSIANTPYTFATLLCSEATSYTPLFFYEKEHPSFYILQSNLSIMHGKLFALSEYYNYSKLVAITTGKPVIAVSNQAPSFIYDSYGRRLQKTEVKNALYQAF